RAALLLRATRRTRRHARLPGGLPPGPVPPGGLLRRGPRRAPPALRPRGRLRAARAADPSRAQDLLGARAGLPSLPTETHVPLRARANASNREFVRIVRARTPSELAPR